MFFSSTSWSLVLTFFPRFEGHDDLALPFLLFLYCTGLCPSKQILAAALSEIDDPEHSRQISQPQLLEIYDKYRKVGVSLSLKLSFLSSFSVPLLRLCLCLTLACRPLKASRRMILFLACRFSTLMELVSSTMKSSDRRWSCTERD